MLYDVVCVSNIGLDSSRQVNNFHKTTTMLQRLLGLYPGFIAFLMRVVSRILLLVHQEKAKLRTRILLKSVMTDQVKNI